MIIDGGRTTGVLLLGDVSGVPADERSDRSVGELAVPIDELVSVGDDTQVVGAVQAFFDEHRELTFLQAVALFFQREGEEHAGTLELTPLADGRPPDQRSGGGTAERGRARRRPSAGLMLALGTSATASGVELADERGIAGSGTIDLSGNVEPVRRRAASRRSRSAHCRKRSSS